MTHRRLVNLLVVAVVLLALNLVATVVKSAPRPAPEPEPARKRCVGIAVLSKDLMFRAFDDGTVERRAPFKGWLPYLDASGKLIER